MRIYVAGCTLFMALVAMHVRADVKKKPAADKPAGKGFWKVLVTPNAKWVLRDTILDKTATITVETYDVRTVAGADVARLRWTHAVGKDKYDISDRRGAFSQVAVTPAGLFLMTNDMDDAKVAAALAGKPSRSDPPKPYKGTKQNNGRYLRVDGGTVCMGNEPLPDAGPCPDTCEGEVCITSDGIWSLSGNYAPNDTTFVRD